MNEVNNVYKFPIEIVIGDMYTRMAKQQEDSVYQTVLNYGINVDKQELIRALEYDREEYGAGYKDGVREFANYLKDCAFLCDPGNGYSFDAIDTDDLDDYIEDFFEHE